MTDCSCPVDAGDLRSVLEDVRLLGTALGELEHKIADMLRQMSELAAPVESSAAASELTEGKPGTAEHTDDLELIAGMDRPTVVLLQGKGLTRFFELEHLTSERVRDLARALGDPERIGRENWIEQAAILARGELTSFARRKMRLATPSILPILTELPVPAEAQVMPVDLPIDAATSELRPATTGTDLVVIPFGNRQCQNPGKARRWLRPVLAASALAAAVVAFVAFTSAGRFAWLNETTHVWVIAAF